MKNKGLMQLCKDSQDGTLRKQMELTIALFETTRRKMSNKDLLDIIKLSKDKKLINYIKQLIKKRRKDERN